MKHITAALLSLTLLAAYSCNNATECSNKSAVLAQSPPNSTPYNVELLRLINTADSNSLKYYFESYQQKGEMEQITVRVQGEDFCAKGHFAMDQWTGLENIKETKGEGYQGALLDDFAFTVIGGDQAIQLVFQSVKGISD